jgi:hypothetical protein
MVSVTRKWPPISGQRPNCTYTSYYRWGAILLVGSAGFRFLFNPVTRLGHHIASPNFYPNHSTLSTYLSMLFEFNPPPNQLDPTMPPFTATRAPPIPLTTHFCSNWIITITSIFFYQQYPIILPKSFTNPLLPIMISNLFPIRPCIAKVKAKSYVHPQRYQMVETSSWSGSNPEILFSSYCIGNGFNITTKSAHLIVLINSQENTIWLVYALIACVKVIQQNNLNLTNPKPLHPHKHPSPWHEPPQALKNYNQTAPNQYFYEKGHKQTKSMGQNNRSKKF